MFFGDIRNYTHISENLSPQAVVKMLNTYLAAVVDAIIANGGIVNKFGGDNVMAIWNAPHSQDQHAFLAVKAALEAQKKVAELQTTNHEAQPIRFGIGINTGKALAGNVGSVGRAEYTVIGDTVNLASRICSATTGGEVWIGSETYVQTKTKFKTEKLEPQSFKGKMEPVQVYRITEWNQENGITTNEYSG